MALPKSEELELIRLANEGDQDSAKQLVDHHKQRLFSFVWRVVRDVDQAEEICQEAFMRAFGALDTFKKEYRFSTWLFTIGYRLALNHIRSKKHEGVPYDFSNMSGEGQTSPADTVLQSEYARHVKTVIWDEVAKLSSAQRASLTLFYREGLSCQEIAETLELPVATVKSHMHRARQRLRTRLQHCGIDNRAIKYLGA